MKTRFPLLAAAGLLAAYSGSMASDDSPRLSLKPVGTYASGLYDVGAAEIVAHDPKTQRLFVVNAQLAEVEVISIINPSAPVKAGSLDIKPYGAVANSVAFHDGVIAVAVEDAVKTNPGKVVFFDSKLRFVAWVQVGALPDMVTFTPDGRYVLVANEGEPSADYGIDPEGSISIINISGGVKRLTQSKVKTASFQRFNGTTLDASIRIFGPGASVAQDLEPEYVTVSADSKTAWVTCQENNAIAMVDIAAGRITSLVGLGFKDHAAGTAKAATFDFKAGDLPSVGTTLAGQSIPLGGFSGLAFEGVDADSGRYKFVAHTDRGPNAEPVGSIRPFLLPAFTPEVVRFELDRESGSLTVTQRLPLQSAAGVPLTGLPNTAIAGGTGSTAYNDESPVDLLGQPLPLDPLGADLEGIVFAADGTFWMCDEYRPALYHFDANGVMKQRYVPIGTAAAAGAAPGAFGVEVLPAVLAQRRQNRGFEGIAMDQGRIYAFVQSPVRNPSTLSNGALNGMQNIRVVEFNPVTQATKQYIYAMDNVPSTGVDDSRADKMGDAVALGNGEFLVVERDDDSLPGDLPGTIQKKVYQFNLNGATDISAMSGLIGTTGKTVDQLSVAEMVANKINPVAKSLYADLNAAGYNRVEKVEGLAVIDPWTIAVVNDNDFGVAAITVNPDGSFVRTAAPEPVSLGLVTVRHQGLDASDNDKKIKIRPWPVRGVYMPDAIASYQVGKRTFLVTANEGDAREYGTFIEPVRVGSNSVLLDPVRFPDAAVLKNNGNLGRLNILSTLGKNPVTGMFEELYSFGARSFSIWDAAGKLVYDSGDDLERITAQAYPDFFNTSHTNNTMDNRSDDKGPEPEGVVIGKVSGRDYAFIGLERIGGVVVYDISNPKAPVFVDYVNFRDFAQAGQSAPGVSNPLAGDLGPEGLVFISKENSPVGTPLLVMGNEVSGTTTVFAIEELEDDDDDSDDDDKQKD